MLSRRTIGYESNEAQKIVNEYLQQLQKQTFENNIREGKEF